MLHPAIHADVGSEVSIAMQHIQLKIFANPGVEVHFEEAIAVFHRWIQNRWLPELLIDVVNYSHVPAGPGVMLIGHEASYSLDNGGGRAGLLYSRTSAEQLTPRQAYDLALAAARKLEQEPEFAGVLSFNERHFELILNDRLLYPNNETTWELVAPELKTFCESVFAPGTYTVTRPGDPRVRLSVEVS